MSRRVSRQIFIGQVPIGGGAPISVQSMTKTDTRDVNATLREIAQLQEAGCEIARLAVPDMEAAEALADIKRQARLPLVADIHFDHRLALKALEAGMDALRLNPGNIREPDKVRQVVMVARERQVPIRIGVNAGSLPPVEAGGEGAESKPIPERMVEAALGHIRILEDLDFGLIKVSLKAFDVPTTVRAYSLLAERVDYPLHVGITEAGTAWAGTIRSAVGIGILLQRGIGDTIRVSLTGPGVEEVAVGFEILKALNLRERGPVLISCPTCGRTEIALAELASKVEVELRKISEPVKVAVMGCIVNGPGEAREADVGVAGGNGRGVIFRKGEIVRTVDEDELLPALMGELKSVLAEREPRANGE